MSLFQKSFWELSENLVKLCFFQKIISFFSQIKLLPIIPKKKTVFNIPNFFLFFKKTTILKVFNQNVPMEKIFAELISQLKKFCPKPDKCSLKREKNMNEQLIFPSDSLFHNSTGHVECSYDNSTENVFFSLPYFIYFPRFDQCLQRNVQLFIAEGFIFSCSEFSSTTEHSGLGFDFFKKI